MSDPVLEFTGERFTPECVREIWYEHQHRYAFVRALARGRRVLDAACGEGYGSALLAPHARSVTGIDISHDAIAHAQARYAVPGLQFQQADVTALDALPDGSFDLIVSFETLEHVEAQARMLDGFARLLSDDGLLVVSSPDRHTYTDLTGVQNPYHVRELYRDEFEALLAPRFGAVRLYGQKLLFQSALWALDDAGGGLDAATQTADGLREGLGYAPLYFIAVCGKRALPAALPALSLFGDAAESVYDHYNHEVRKNMAAGHRILELEAEVEALRARLAAQAPAG